MQSAEDQSHEIKFKKINDKTYFCQKYTSTGISAFDLVCIYFRKHVLIVPEKLFLAFLSFMM